MDLREAGTDDLDALVERWYTLATEMEPYDELNELSYTDVDDVPRDGIRALLEEENVTVYLVVQADEPIGYVTLRGPTPVPRVRPVPPHRRPRDRREPSERGVRHAGRRARQIAGRGPGV